MLEIDGVADATMIRRLSQRLVRDDWAEVIDMSMGEQRLLPFSPISISRSIHLK
ncbi:MULTISPECIES: hypothetical protein [unclassified Coleofasciculus]|uniref:hypothetical protein n=1 Tax=Cyanophyceae TaxID=3028117 RepID=UPI00168526DB|nr:MULTISPECIES: hypothetical protein [unclassified Coleofasciculus]MBD1879370.1 hypothetical protein [Coleofasciculus sp. FACHB-T130]MBD1899726.1 hypothetical protein [Coleofasciculus sp. FACHB-125]